jgi:transglutaminase-like putative cysteine protease
MHYQISHTTTYTYSKPVKLKPHLVRLRPRSDGFQTLQSFSLLVTPTPKQQCHLTDLDGNTLIKLWFESEPTEHLNVEVLSQAETHLTNPFDYLLEPWATQLPIDYSASLLMQLQPYLHGHLLNYPSSVDPIAVQLAQEISHQVNGNTVAFLSELNQRIYQTCQHSIRETGSPLPAGITWTSRAGSCRDFTVLFMEVCRAIGLAARFVSGYQEGDLDSNDQHLHAWAEVYLPGAGWRGYDPTQGLAVADRHIALVASPIAQAAAPISGSFQQPGGVESVMAYQLIIQALSAEIVTSSQQQAQE